MEGVSIGQYRIVRKLGEGGMGAVWLGEHTLLGRRAAIKVLLPAYSANQAIVQRFFNEAKAVTSVADPGIVQVFDFGQHTDGSAFLVMEYLEGEAMDARLRRIGRFAPLDALRLMRQIATSLSAAHGKGVVHRDLKPENLFIVGDPAVTGGERPKILDFGIAKLAGDEPGKVKTRTGVLMGTPVYMSPEQCRGATSVDHRSDIYALGCVLFTMLVGRPPFEGEGQGDIIIAHVRDVPPTPSALAPGLAPVLDALVLRCLEKDPAARFQSMAEVVQAIGAAETAIYGYDPRHSQQTAVPPYPGAMTPAAQYLGAPGSYPGAPGSYPGAPGSYPGAPGSYPGAPGSYPAAGGSHPGARTPAPADYHGAATPTTPAPGLPTPGLPTPVPANAVTTLGSSVGEAPGSAPRRRTGWIVGGVIAVAGIAGGGFAILSAGPGSSTATGPAAVVGGLDAGTAAPVAGPDAAAVEVVIAADAGVAADAATATAIAADVIDAGTNAGNESKSGGKRRGKRGGANGTSSGSGIVDRGD